MSSAADELGHLARRSLRQGPLKPRDLMNALSVSQPTLSRALRTLGQELLPIGAARSIRYALRDASRSHLDAEVYKVTSEGRVLELGTLVPVCPSGFVMIHPDGTCLHSDGLPWWLFDMRPQGYLGRVFNHRYGHDLGLPARLSDWSDSDVLSALLRRGDELPGNLLVGSAARDAFVNTAPPRPVTLERKAQSYADFAAAVARGEDPGSSAGGEQPKFTAYVETSQGPAHVIVKFTALIDTPISARWRDLLLAEHVALDVLAHHGLPAARSSVYDHAGQRFLEVRRFDREGPSGRRALFSLMALDAEFVGSGERWPHAVRALARSGVVTADSVATTDVLWAFGVLIGNTDMHSGNLSFLPDEGRPYRIAPAYDMTCMAFAPTAGGDLPMRELPLRVSSEVTSSAWHKALEMATDFHARLARCDALSPGFAPCADALTRHIGEASQRIARLTA